MRGLRSRRLVRLIAVPLAVASGAIGLSGCLGSAAPNSQLTTYAEFSDVEQLVSGAPVDMADIPIGHVDAITLAGDRAKVKMTIERSAGVPAAVKAELEQTSVLGDYFVQLIPTKSGPSGLLANDAMIERSAVQPEIEQLVQAGSQVFGAIPDSELAEIIQAGGQGFGGQSSNIRQLLDDFAAVSTGYESRDGEIQSLINNLNQLSAGLAPSANADAQAISNLSATIGVLQSQSTQFINLLQALDNLSIQGHSLLGGSLPQIDDELTSLSATAGELAAHQQDIALLVQNLPYYDEAANGATMHDFIQVFEDIIVCGVPGGGEDDSSPATTCAPTGGGS